MLFLTVTIIPKEAQQNLTYITLIKEEYYNTRLKAHGGKLESVLKR